MPRAPKYSTVEGGGARSGGMELVLATASEPAEERDDEADDEHEAAAAAAATAAAADDDDDDDDDDDESERKTASRGLRRPQPTGSSGGRREMPATTDPCACICEEIFVSPKIGHSYVVFTFGQRNQAIVGPHWAGMLYTASLITGSTIAFIGNTCVQRRMLPAIRWPPAAKPRREPPHSCLFPVLTWIGAPPPATFPLLRQGVQDVVDLHTAVGDPVLGLLDISILDWLQRPWDRAAWIAARRGCRWVLWQVLPHLPGLPAAGHLPLRRLCRMHRGPRPPLPLDGKVRGKEEYEMVPSFQLHMDR